MQIELKAKSSKPDNYYFVTFGYENDRLSVFCDCPAGKFGKFCKHKWQFLGGNTKMLFDESESGQLATVANWATERNYTELYNGVEALEVEIKKLKKQIAGEKKAIERKFREGF